MRKGLVETKGLNLIYNMLKGIILELRYLAHKSNDFAKIPKKNGSTYRL